MPLTSAGLTIPRLEEILAAIEDQIRSEVSPTADLDRSTPEGQLAAIFARQTRIVYEGLAELYGALSPATATGAALDGLATLAGTERDPATRTRTDAEITFTSPGVFAPGEILAYSANNDLFRNVVSVTVTSAGTQSVTMEAAVAGSGVDLLAGELSDLVSPGGTITNPTAGTVGTDADTDAQLRDKISDENASENSSVQGIYAAITGLDGVVEALVLEDVPTRSFEAVVFGPDPATPADDEALAQKIADVKAAGVGTTGDRSVVVQVEQGDSRVPVEIFFTRPSIVECSILVAIETAPGFAGVLEVESTIEQRGEGLSVGDDLDWSEVVGWVMGVSGVLRVTTISAYLSSDPAAALWSSVSIGPREVARINNISVVATPGSS